MSDAITYATYWGEIASLASSIREDVEDGTLEDYEAVLERLHGDTDGHQWVIYTGYNYAVLQHSSNDGYYAEEFGTDGLLEGGILRTDRLAWGAMYADLIEHTDVEEAISTANEREAA